MTATALTPPPGPPPTAAAAVVPAALAFLRRLVDDRVAPTEALRELAELRTRHPGVRLDLVWDVERFDGSIHYDLLVREGTHTTSLSVTADGDGLPWPLRGAQRVGDTVLLDVDGERLEVGEAVGFLDTLDDELPTGIAQRLVDACILRAELAARLAVMGEDDEEEAVRRYRERFALHDDEALERWCRVRGCSPAELRRTALSSVVLARLRRDGVDGVGLENWLDQRRRSADIRWYWSVGGRSSEGQPR